MCPACITTLALIAAAAGSAGGLTAFVAKKLNGGKEPKAHEQGAEPETPEAKEESR